MFLLIKLKYLKLLSCLLQARHIKKVVNDLNNGTITFMENIRFHPEEENNDENFSKKLRNGDYFVNDAFSVSIENMFLHMVYQNIYQLCWKIFRVRNENA